MNEIFWKTRRSALKNSFPDGLNFVSWNFYAIVRNTEKKSLPGVIRREIYCVKNSYKY